MGWAWSTIGILGVTACLMAWALAAVVWAAGASRPAPRRLALVLFLEGALAGTGTGLMYLTTDAATATGFQAVAYVSFAAMPFAYLAFLAHLPTPLVRPLRAPGITALLTGLAVATVAFMVARMDLFILGMERVPYATWDSVTGEAMLVLWNASLVVFVFALVAAFSAYRRAGAGAARGQALAFLWAFGLRDGLIACLIVLTAIGWETAGAYMPPIILLLYVPLLAYGILRTQLFDLDLRIKWTLKQSTVAGAFLGVFFLVSEAAAAFFGETTGSTYAGIGAAALLVFAIAPLQRLAERVSDAAMPGVEATPAYLAYKKMELYRAALEGAMEDGDVTDKERAVLARVRDKLDLSGDDAAALEAEVLGAPLTRPS